MTDERKVCPSCLHRLPNHADYCEWIPPEDELTQTIGEARKMWGIEPADEASHAKDYAAPSPAAEPPQDVAEMCLWIRRNQLPHVAVVLESIARERDLLRAQIVNLESAVDYWRAGRDATPT